MIAARVALVARVAGDEDAPWRFADEVWRYDAAMRTMAAVFLVAACGGARPGGEPAATAVPPYASAAPIAQPRLFAPGAVSTVEPEFSISFAADGASYPTAALLDDTATGTETNPAISPDGTLLVFASDRDGGIGGADLYLRRLRDGAWSTAANLGPAINSPLADFAPAFSPDGKYLFFTSERPGIAPTPPSGRPPGDIYQIDVAALGRGAAP